MDRFFIALRSVQNDKPALICQTKAWRFIGAFSPDETLAGESPAPPGRRQEFLTLAPLAEGIRMTNPAQDGNIVKSQSPAHAVVSYPDVVLMLVKT